MYQDAVGGKHPTHTVIGHAVSRDFVHWAHMPVSIWHDRPWDWFAVFTGSASVIEGKPYLIYPGNVQGGFDLAMAIPADPADPLYTNWTKDRRPGYDVAANPIVSNTSDDPSTAWRTVHGEYRFLANGVGPQFKNAHGKPANSSHAPIFAAQNFTGSWRYVGDSPLLAGECGSLFPLPPLYSPADLNSNGTGVTNLPTHVHKRGCGPGTCVSWGARGDHMTLGTWTDGRSPSEAGTWTPFSAERTIDYGNLYAGKDMWDGAKQRRIFFGWATVQTSPQTLARVVTYHQQLQQLMFSPAPEYAELHQRALGHLGATTLESKALVPLGASSDGLQTADINVTYVRPKINATIGISILGEATVFVDFVAGASSVRVGIYDGSPKFPSPPTPPLTGSAPIRMDSLRLLPTDDTIAIRAFTDTSVLEVYWMDGRVAMTSPLKGQGTDVQVFSSTSGVGLMEATAQEMGSIWVSPHKVLDTPRLDASNG
jgi:sucrose-6-phosphate hydrolase SacC (GH32 family)